MMPWEKYQQAAPQIAGPWAKYAQPDTKQAEQRPSDDGMPLQSFRDSSVGVGQGVTLGFADELFSAGMTPLELARGHFTGQDDGKGIGQRISDAYGRALDFNRKFDKAAQDRSPASTTIGEVVGGGVTAGGLARGGVTLMNTARPTTGNMIARGAGEGAIYGGIHGVGKGETTQERIEGGITGGAIGAITGGAIGGVGARQARKAAIADAPTTQELRQMANTAYKAAEDSDVVVNPARFKSMVDDMFTTLANEGVDPTLHPGVMQAFKRLQELQNQPVAFKTLDILRRVANSAGKSIQNKDEQRLAGIMVDKIDDLMNGLRPQDVLSGDGAAAGRAIVTGRDLWLKMRKSEVLENLMERAENRAGANYTTAGMQTAIKQEMKNLLNSKHGTRGFSEQEKNLMKAIVRGGPMENITRLVGKLAVRGPVSGVISILGGNAIGGPAGAAVLAGAGEGAKALSARMTTQKMENLMAAVRRGGPAVLQRLSPETRAMLSAFEAAQVPIQDQVPRISTAQ
jgi:hypothetical protein